MYDKICTTQPFFVPALAARPLVHGLPPSREECLLPVETAGGYFSYDDSSRSTAMSDAELCANVRRLGFATALVLEGVDDSRKVTCR